MAGVLNQLEAFGAARGVLVQAPRALVLAVYVVGTDDPFPRELQPRSAPVAARAFAHDGLDRGRTMSRSTRLHALPYIQI